MVGEVSGNAVNFAVTVKLTDADANVRPGMTASVDIITATKEGALLIPNQAIFVENGERVIYLEKPGQGIVRIVITVGISSDSYSELATGEVQAGDTIVLTPPGKAYTQQNTGRFGRMFGGGGGGNRTAQPGQNNQQPGGQQQGPQGSPQGAPQP